MIRVSLSKTRSESVMSAPRAETAPSVAPVLGLQTPTMLSRNFLKVSEILTDVWEATGNELKLLYYMFYDLYYIFLHNC